MNTNQLDPDCRRPDGGPYALHREGGHWQLTFEGQQTLFKHELGALYVAYLLLHPPRGPLHAVALALKAREARGQPEAADELEQQRRMVLNDAMAVRGLWRRQRELERVLADRMEIEPVKAEALPELERVSGALRHSHWLHHDGAARCVRAVGEALLRFHKHLLEPADAKGRAHPVLQSFAGHLHRHLLVPSGRGSRGQWRWLAMVPAGFFTYVPPRGVVWTGSLRQGLESGVSGLKSTVDSPRSTVYSPPVLRSPCAVEVRQSVDSTAEGGPVPGSRTAEGGVSRGSGLECNVSGLKSTNQSLRSAAQDARLKTQDARAEAQDDARRPGVLGLLSRLLCAGVALGLLSGCVVPRPFKGGKASTTRNQAGVIQQTVAQGENASQPSRQDQETIKVRSYTLPAATRIEQCAAPLTSVRAADRNVRAPGAPEPRSEPSTLNPQLSTSYILSAPMPVIEREETRARTELGAAQKDTARDLAAKLSSLKGIVWVGVGLFVFGLASLVYPPLKAIVASVTTSVALMLGGVALIVLPTMVVGNELLILGVVALVVGVWFLAHRHGQLSGLVAASTAGAPANSTSVSATPQAPKVQGAAK